MRELELLRADPAGNVTLLVLTPVEAPLRSACSDPCFVLQTQRKGRPAC